MGLCICIHCKSKCISTTYWSALCRNVVVRTTKRTFATQRTIEKRKRRTASFVETLSKAHVRML